MRSARVILRGAALVRASPGSSNGFGNFNSLRGEARPAGCLSVGGVRTAVDLAGDKQLITTVSRRQDAFDVGHGEAIRDKKMFMLMLERFKIGNPHHKGHVEFILVALDKLEDFQVAEDIDAYKALMDLFPKGKLIAKNLIQAHFYHAPRHQDTGLQILVKMESNGVMPDREMRRIILEAFGSESDVFKKLGRMVYWMPKFRNASPWPLPKPVPRDSYLLARLAVERMMTVDPESDVETLHSDEVPESIDKTWIVSGQSPKQIRLLRQETGEIPLRIEGPCRIWLRDSVISYFVLVGEPREKPQISINTDEVSKIRLTFFGEKPLPEHDITQLPTVHEQSDATIFAICATGTSSRDSLLSWLRLLEKTNPCLKNLPVVFKLLAPTQALTKIGKQPANENTADFQEAETPSEENVGDDPVNKSNDAPTESGDKKDAS